MMENLIRRAMQGNASYLRRGVTDAMYWALPLGVGVVWFVWPFMDQEDLLKYNLMADPEAEVNMIHNAKMQRLEAYTAAKGIGAVGSAKKSKADDAGEEEEEETEEDSGDDSTEQNESGDSGEDEEGEKEETAGEEGEVEEDDGGDADGEGEAEEDAGDEEEEEEEEAALKIGVFLPTKGDKLTLQEQWDNFAIKSVNYGEDEDDEDEDDEGKLKLFFTFYSGHRVD